MNKFWLLSSILMLLVTASATNAQCPLFAPEVNYGVGNVPWSVVSVDYDNDGEQNTGVFMTSSCGRDGTICEESDRCDFRFEDGLMGALKAYYMD